MAKLSKEQADQLAELEKLRDAPDEDYEVRMEVEGRSISVPYSRVPAKWRDLFGFSGDAAKDAGDDGDDGDDGDGDGDGKSKADPSPRSGHRYFT